MKEAAKSCPWAGVLGSFPLRPAAWGELWTDRCGVGRWVVERRESGVALKAGRLRAASRTGSKRHPDRLLAAANRFAGCANSASAFSRLFRSSDLARRWL